MTFAFILLCLVILFEAGLIWHLTSEERKRSGGNNETNTLQERKTIT